MGRSRRTAKARAVLVVWPIAVRCRSRLRRVQDLRTLLDGLDAWAQKHPRPPIRSEDLVAATNWSLRVLRAPDRSCVHRSLVLYTVLRCQGRDATFTSGARRVGDGLDGHAWVASDALAPALTGDDGSAVMFATGFVHPQPTRRPGAGELLLDSPADRRGADDDVPVLLTDEGRNFVGKTVRRARGAAGDL